MSFTAPHIGFVLVSYGFSALVLGGLTVAILWQSRSMAQRLKDLEARAVRRRKPAKPAQPVESS